MSHGLEAQVESFLQKNVPNIDADLLSYVVDVTSTSADDFESVDDLYDAVGGVLHEATENEDEDEIKKICHGVLNLFKKPTSNGTEERNGKDVKILNAPINIGTRAEEADQKSIDQNAIFLKQTEEVQLKTVDLKKLEKINAKLSQKQEKRDKDAPYEEIDANAGPTTNQVVQKKDAKCTDTSGKVDVRIENFDLAYGSKVLLQNASLVMAFGRRYGFVGRNGMGKTTLLRSISKRDLYIPPHLTVLHVEQEVRGDDTLAVDSVLQADIERTELLKREAELSAKIKAGVEGNTASELSAVYAKLSEIEADKAPARAALILFGLGFSTEMQNMTTKEFSGGWRMRLALARALFTKPDLLLLDEPTNMLDVKAILWLENYLQTWPTTLLVVSHDRMFLDAVATDIVFLHSKVCFDCTLCLRL